MKITLYPGGSHNYEQVYLECEQRHEYRVGTVFLHVEAGQLCFTGRREGLQTRVRIVTTVPYLIETEGK